MTGTRTDFTSPSRSLVRLTKSIKPDEQRFQVRDKTLANYPSDAMDLSAACALGNVHSDDEDSTDESSMIEDPLQNFYTKKRRREKDDVSESEAKRKSRRLNLRMKRCVNDPDDNYSGTESSGAPISGKRLKQDVDLRFFGQSLVNFTQGQIGM